MKEEVVRLLREMADAMRRSGDRHRVRAYSRAAEAIEKRDDFDELLRRGRLQTLSGVGPNIEKKVLAFVKRGEEPAWLADRSKLPTKLRGSAVTRARAAAGDMEVEAPPEAYFLAPFADAPDLHVHSTWSDGTLSMEELIVWARELRAPALGISDHSGSLRIANGLRPDEVREQWDDMEALQGEHPDVLLLRGTECDILRDGRLDHPPEILDGFDYVIASLHQQLRLPETEQTPRILKALDDPHVTILGHPTTRVPNHRPRANLDLDKIFRKCADRGIALEVNGNPGRIDLDAELAHKALEMGCKLAVTSDGHSAREMLSLATAKLIALEAGANPRDIVNYDVAGAAPTNAPEPGRPARSTRGS